MSEVASSQDYGYPMISRPSKPTVTISGNSGGHVIRFALHKVDLERKGAKVRFAGRCDSACTMYLGLPKKQVCVTPRAYFRFHRPSGGSAQAVRAAEKFMVKMYPQWVRSWIRAHGGLSSRLVKMDYSYASRYLPTCA